MDSNVKICGVKIQYVKKTNKHIKAIAFNYVFELENNSLFVFDKDNDFINHKCPVKIDDFESLVNDYCLNTISKWFNIEEGTNQ